MEYIQFVQTRKIKCKYGDAIETNSMDVGSFIGSITHFPTIANGTKQGEIVAEIKTKDGYVYAHINDYIVRNNDGSFSVYSPDEFEGRGKDILKLTPVYQKHIRVMLDNKAIKYVEGKWYIPSIKDPYMENSVPFEHVIEYVVYNHLSLVFKDPQGFVDKVITGEYIGTICRVDDKGNITQSPVIIGDLLK